MSVIATLVSKHGRNSVIEFADSDLQSLARARRVDAVIVSTEDGFSPLGRCRAFLSADLGIAEDDIARLANWNRFDNPQVSLLALGSRRTSSLLKVVILAPSESSECYRAFAVPRYGRPYRDFYYNVTYEAIAHVCRGWGATRLAISHLSGTGTFHEDIATCNAEALAHYCDEDPTAQIEALVFFGCCINVSDLSGIARLNAEARSGRHRPIKTKVEQRDGCDVIHLLLPQKS